MILDLDDTLIDDVRAAREAVVHTLSTVALPNDVETTELALRFIRKLWKAHPHRHTGPLAHVSGWEALWLPRENTGLPEPVIESLRQHEIRVWRAILDSRRGDLDKASTAVRAYRVFRHEHVRSLPGIHATLNLLRRNHRLWLATNGLPAHQRRKLSGAALTGFFDRILVSGEVGAAKSNPVFASVTGRALAQDELGVCLVVGDSVTQDLGLASNGGWAAAHICPAGWCDATVASREAAVTHVPSLSHVVCECPPPTLREPSL
ncbi:HAD family hydrolase [Micromonospora rubida]|uniref:HAD family hydrolase n=1 Tax=Micromonospora rubida TaxID=2697657 RepID=UPI001376F127|nr:HAD family hydrolase [Micromonospora rubida]NBE82150.1 HAD hydrolase-like protein [Micromonospora rubida]